MVAAFHPLDVERWNVSKPENTRDHLEAGLNQRLQKRRDDKLGTHFQPLELSRRRRRGKFLVETRVLRKHGPPPRPGLGCGHGRDLAPGFVAEEFDRVECRGFRFVHSADFLPRCCCAGADGARVAERNRGGSIRPGYSRIEYQRKRGAVIVVKRDGRVRDSRDRFAEFVTRQAA